MSTQHLRTSLTPDNVKVSKKNRKSKPHRTNQNSIDSYKELKKTGKIESEAEKVIRLVSELQPITNRQLTRVSGIERASVCRSLYDLVGCGKVKVAYNDKCPITNKTVGWYSLPEYEVVTDLNGTEGLNGN